jgi:hypothetical protein
MARFDYRDLRLLGLFTNAWAIVHGVRGSPTAEHPVEQAINYSIYSPPVEQSWQDAWRVTEGLIEAARDATVKHGAMFLAVTEDTGIQVWPDAAVRAKFAKQLHVPDLLYPDRRIAALGQRGGFAVLTLAEPLQRYAQAHQVFLHGFKNTPMGFGHWNASGHAQAGELIAHKLCAMIQSGDCSDCGVTPPASLRSAGGL